MEPSPMSSRPMPQIYSPATGRFEIPMSAPQTRRSRQEPLRLGAVNFDLDYALREQKRLDEQLAPPPVPVDFDPIEPVQPVFAVPVAQETRQRPDYDPVDVDWDNISDHGRAEPLSRRKRAEEDESRPFHDDDSEWGGRDKRYRATKKHRVEVEVSGARKRKTTETAVATPPKPQRPPRRTNNRYSKGANEMDVDSDETPEQPRQPVTGSKLRSSASKLASSERLSASRDRASRSSGSLRKSSPALSAQQESEREDEEASRGRKRQREERVSSSRAAAQRAASQLSNSSDSQEGPMEEGTPAKQPSVSKPTESAPKPAPTSTPRAATAPQSAPTSHSASKPAGSSLSSAAASSSTPGSLRDSTPMAPDPKRRRLTYGELMDGIKKAADLTPSMELPPLPVLDPGAAFDDDNSLEDIQAEARLRHAEAAKEDEIKRQEAKEKQLIHVLGSPSPVKPPPQVATPPPLAPFGSLLVPTPSAPPVDASSTPAAASSTPAAATPAAGGGLNFNLGGAAGAAGGFAMPPLTSSASSTPAAGAAAGGFSLPAPGADASKYVLSLSASNSDLLLWSVASC